MASIIKGHIETIGKHIETLSGHVNTATSTISEIADSMSSIHTKLKDLHGKLTDNPNNETLIAIKKEAEKLPDEHVVEKQGIVVAANKMQDEQAKHGGHVVVYGRMVPFKLIIVFLIILIIMLIFMYVRHPVYRVKNYIKSHI